MSACHVVSAIRAPAEDGDPVGEADQNMNARRTELGEPFRGPEAMEAAHQEPEIATGHMDQQSFEDVLVAAQVRTPHAAGFVAVGERTFHKLAASAEEPFSPFPSNAPPVGVDQIGRASCRERVYSGV